MSCYITEPSTVPDKVLLEPASQPTNLLVTFLEYSSIVMQDTKGKDSSVCKRGLKLWHARDYSYIAWCRYSNSLSCYSFWFSSKKTDCFNFSVDGSISWKMDSTHHMMWCVQSIFWGTCIIYMYIESYNPFKYVLYWNCFPYLLLQGQLRLFWRVTLLHSGVFISTAWKVCRVHLVIRSSVCPTSI